ncbi:hypothetical protein G9G63_20150 [Paenibacillus sp. EKM202P]|uniref:hypothetical protein n=1 Tax=unclassified Paenibacillus TaxID=185978 RepID=UPI0013EBAC7C|nr:MULTISPECIES: hypothetical protein [unclassified Paenibacillus]KAF6561967.1 hypothetical protein G9G63_20150 [Paenibacillus sp. EKM202P]KAF6566255.1 hypothetical protein G9G64_19285 [Paenibacillus sp. EKM207P]
MAMVWEQGELFAKATKQEIQRTKFLLEKYTDMVALMKDFEQFEQELQQVGIDGEAARRIDQTDLHADKTVNATILIEKQRWVYSRYDFYTRQLRRAHGLIKDDDARKAIEYRYIQGYTYKETLLFFRRSLSDSTIRRKLGEGTESMANTLKLMGFFDMNNTEL